MRLPLMWWNTSLSPVAKRDRSENAVRKAAFDLVRYFTDDLGFDLVALGEVSAADIAEVKDRCGSEFSVFDGAGRIGRTAFDTCVLYRKNRLDLLGESEVAVLDGGSTLRVAQRLDFLLPDQQTKLHLFVSHWPSRLWCHENHADRDRLGVWLRDSVVKVLGDDHQGHAIVLGDFNDEPFAKSMQDQLLASRDRNLVARKKHLLYNPFWRHLGAASQHIPGQASEDSHGGSYWYPSGRTTRWHTFDQIIFSSAFVGNSAWHIDEQATRVLDVPAYTQLVTSRDSQFDHMPVVTVIEKEL